MFSVYLRSKPFGRRTKIKPAFFIFFFIFFLLPAFGAFSETKVHFTPSLECENKIIDYVNQAQSIDVAVYAISNDNIVDALANAYLRGADIRIVTDKVQSHGRSSKVPFLRKLGLSIKTNKGHRIEHNKFAIFDQKTVVTGSYNWTNPASSKNSENCFFTDLEVSEFQNRYEYLWAKY